MSKPDSESSQSPLPVQNLQILLRQPQATSCFADAQKPCWLPVPSSMSIITRVSELYCYSPDTTLAHATHLYKANSPLQGDRQKAWNWISFTTYLPGYYPLAQRKNVFFQTLTAMQGFVCVCVLVFIRLSYPFLVLPVQLHVLPGLLWCFH